MCATRLRDAVRGEGWQEVLLQGARGSFAQRDLPHAGPAAVRAHRRPAPLLQAVSVRQARRSPRRVAVRRGCVRYGGTAPEAKRRRDPVLLFKAEGGRAVYVRGPEPALQEG